MQVDLIVRSDHLVTCKAGQDAGIIDGYLAVKDGLITAVGEGEAPSVFIGDDTVYIDACGKTVTPGLIDAHTHLVHAGSRENELEMKLKGVHYLEILKKGGGILSTVRSTRNATKTELKNKARISLDQMLLYGTTTIEAKSGYGLDLDTEVRCLEVALELAHEHPVDIVNTYMGAHAVPEEYKTRPQDYINYMIDVVMPYVSDNNLAEFIDVFCEDGAFSPDECRKLMQNGKNLGFKLKIHADEIVPLQGAELAAEMAAVSAEHLMAVSDAGIDAMGQAGVTAVLLPGTTFYLMSEKYADAGKMLLNGVRVALATDYNPGTCPTENLQAIMPFACFGMKLTPEQIFQCLTLNAAFAIDRSAEIGSLETGKKADIVIFNAPNLNYIVYHFGINHVDKVIKNGRLVVDNGIRLTGARGAWNNGFADRYDIKRV